MNQEKKNPYATNAAGIIIAPNKPGKNEPKGTRTVSDGDLRVKKAKK